MRKLIGCASGLANSTDELVAVGRAFDALDRCLGDKCADDEFVYVGGAKRQSFDGLYKVEHDRIMYDNELWASRVPSATNDNVYYFCNDLNRHFITFRVGDDYSDYTFMEKSACYGAGYCVREFDEVKI